MFEIISFLSVKLATREGLATFGPFVALIGVLFLSAIITILSKAQIPSYGAIDRRSQTKQSFGVAIKKSAFLLYFLLTPLIVIALVFTCNISHPRFGVIARKVLPAMFSDYSSSSIEAQLPVHPKNMTEAYEYGRVYERFTQCSANELATKKPAEYDACVADAIRSAEELYHHGPVPAPSKKRRNITTTDLESLKSVIDEIDNRKGPLQKFASYFTLVGFLWIISIAGICALVIPFVGIFFGKLLAKLFVSLILPILELVWKLVIQPFGGAILYFCSFWAIVESTRYPLNDAYSISGVMLAILGIGLFAAAWGYITFQLPKSGDNFRKWATLTGTVGFLFTFELSVIHHSKLIGYFTIACLILVVTVSAAAEIFVEILWGRRNARWNDRELLNIVVSLFFVQLFGYAFAALEDREFLTLLFGQGYIDTYWIAGGGSTVAAPFRDSFAYVGGTVFFWFFLVISFFTDGHLQFLVSCVLYIIVGFVCDAPGVMQVAMVYLGTWVVIFFLCETFRRSDIVVGGFVGSVALFFLANFLSNHPEFVTLVFFGPSK